MSDYMPGDKSTCKICNKPITYIGIYWDHDGDINTRHIGIPSEGMERDSDKQTYIHPCPFCGEPVTKEVRRLYWSNYYHDNEYAVVCSDNRCGTVGPTRDTKEGAISAWNAACNGYVR